ncbi:hypothetical protein Zmor_023057 [Zophobas morio]|uniref:methylated diphthine methylhydrolase n=1 Tax=Zophobas morio TaxID=2755281 RepID=A0AA38HY25_9CUCU|nr:hypothetical protein Zmor_023057 [Zophobas morio]
MSDDSDEKPPCKQITTLHTYKTDFNADSVEWCPHEPHQNVFVCANYQLKESKDDTNAPRERFGCILLFSVSLEELRLLQTLPTAAILDQKWCHNPVNGCSILGVANAQKTIEIYALNANTVQLDLITSYQLEDDDSETLVLSLDWSTGKYESSEPELVCSDSKGKIHRFKFTNNELVRDGSWNGHDFEAWIAAFYYWEPNIFFSGGDDCVFLKFDKRAGLEPVSRNRNHEAGVTSIHSNSKREYVLATGSYDTQVRLWDIRFLKNCTSCIKTPGTLWRLKWDPFYHKHLLAACMLGGVHIIKSNNPECLEIVDSYYKHENISYGADWSFSPINSKEQALIATCSFYDNLLCVSQVGLNNQ